MQRALGIHLGTVHTHMPRMRIRHPRLYRVLMAESRRQLAARHDAVIAERRLRSLRWGRRQSASRFRRQHGSWPWELMRVG
ncbi:MAG TPA: hypothetical protein VGR23_08025 [Candidatus Dormibacteraeota bacterium]|nr:hypothetical protein [Candidatus Dormibacteraeota bacterium]